MGTASYGDGGPVNIDTGLDTGAVDLSAPSVWNLARETHG
jgi:hypothetical protein